MIRLMLIEDDDVLGFIIKEGLELAGDYEVLWINNAMQAINAFNEFYPDIVVSDIDMPGLNGLEIARKIKAIDSEIPIVLETCVSSSKVILEAYSIGIDNYIKKPFLPDELDAYVKGLLKRIHHQEDIKKDENSVYLGSIEFNTKLQTLKTATGTINLTTREAALLELLYRNLDHLVTKETIAETLWGGIKYFTPQRLDVFIYNIRKYLSADKRVSIKTLRGIGYTLSINK